MLETIGSRLRAAREKKGWSQTYAARRIGIANSTLSGYERDYRRPTPDQFPYFAELYEVSVDYLLCKTDDPTPTTDIIKNIVSNAEKQLKRDQDGQLEKVNDRTNDIINAIEIKDISQIIDILENTKNLQSGGKTLTDTQRRAVIDFFKQVVVRNINNSGESK